MIAELGHFALIMALFAALAQSVAPLWGAERGWADFMRVGQVAATAQFVLIAISFAALTYAFVTSDFSVALVVQHSHETMPTLYKVSGVWGNHEGSMLLWVLILSLFGAMIGWFGANLPLPLKARTLGVQGLIGVAFLAFILFTSNPFARLLDPPVSGADLNPVLQDPGLAFHPPFLYLGYVGLSTTFSFAVAAMIEGRIDAAWARWVRPWTLAAWVFLTIGIALGSYWAYYELGWGGWWFWDPVENASFMPWLAAAALLHSAVVVEKRGELKSWTILLAIVGFSLSLIGTFIVRSGVLTSVHAFASDPSRGVFILLILAVSIGGALLLYARRAEAMASGGLFAPVSRESALLLNNLLLAVATASVFAGTLAPIVYQAFGKTVTVGPPYFEWVFGAIMVPLLIALPVGAMLPWKRGDIGRALGRLWVVGAVAGLILATVWALESDAAPMAPIGAALASWVVIGSFWDLAERAGFGRLALGEAFGRLTRLPRSDWGKTLGHAGLGLTLFGMTLSTALQTEDVRLAKPGERYETGGYAFEFRSVTPVQGPNYRSQRAEIDVYSGETLIDTLDPEQRFFTAKRTTTSEVALHPGFLRDLYVVLGEQRDDGSWALRTYVKPFVSWIWLGTLVMALGGCASLSDRRHRVGAPAARRRAAPAAAVPAE